MLDYLSLLIKQAEEITENELTNSMKRVALIVTENAEYKIYDDVVSGFSYYTKESL